MLTFFEEEQNANQHKGEQPLDHDPIRHVPNLRVVSGSASASGDGSAPANDAVAVDTPRGAHRSDDAQESALREIGVLDSHIRIARQRQSLTHESMAEIMRSAEYGFLTPEQVARVNAKVENLAYFSPAQIDGIPALKIRAALAKNDTRIKSLESMLPVDIQTDANGRETMLLAVSDPRTINNAQLLYPNWRHAFCVCSERTLQTLYRRAYAQSGADALTLYQALKHSRIDDEGADSLLREFILSVMRHACYLGASDIAFTPMTSGSGGVVRMKVNGVGTIFTFLESAIWQRTIVHMLTTAGASESIKAGPVDTRFEFTNIDLVKYSELRNRYDFRMVLIQRRRSEQHSVSVVMRILDQQAESAELSALDFDERTLRHLNDIKSRSTGLFLVTGPTGSGKTTTLYALLNEIDPVSRWIESIEKPIEFSKGLWIQFQIPDEEAKGAESLLKGILRAAPNVISVGEVRKGDLALELIDAANTGHLVFSTLHNNNAAMAISRLRSFNLDMSTVASLLLGILAQRLVLTLCQCAVPDTRGETLQLLRSIGFLNQPGQNIQPRMACGCPECNHTGYRGRKMIYELLMVTPRVQELIESNAAPSVIADEGISQHRTLVGNGLKLVAQGVTSIEEIQKLGDLEQS
jgi:type II secretory ATPase GspE/PulE/Tfp pilus assembly ATPase PilB-like protein